MNVTDNEIMNKTIHIFHDVFATGLFAFATWVFTSIFIKCMEVFVKNILFLLF